jgi:hypothetical protein
MKLTTIQAHFESKTRRCIISDALNECALYCYESGCYYESRLEPGGLSDCQDCYYARVIRYLSGTLTLTKHELSLIYNQKYGRLDTYGEQPGTISTPESEDYIPW